MTQYFIQMVTKSVRERTTASGRHCETRNDGEAIDA